MTRFASLLAVVAFAVLVVVAGERPFVGAAGTGRTEVVVLLDSPPLAEAPDDEVSDRRGAAQIPA